jgi:hypothetical protein
VLGFSIPSFSACEISSAGFLFFNSCRFINDCLVLEESYLNICVFCRISSPIKA